MHFQSIISGLEILLINLIQFKRYDKLSFYRWITNPRTYLSSNSTTIYSISIYFYLFIVYFIDSVSCHVIKEGLEWGCGWRKGWGPSSSYPFFVGRFWLRELPKFLAENQNPKEKKITTEKKHEWKKSACLILPFLTQSTLSIFTLYRTFFWVFF